MNLYDAHSHLHFPELSEVDWEVYFKGVSRVAVNGTQPRDWEAVAEFTRSYPERVNPQFGVHPWEVKGLPEGWEEELEGYLTKFPNAGVGEIGLDKWFKGYDLSLQSEVLKAQIGIANDLDRPVTIHCLKAWGTLRELLYANPIKKNFLLHAYGGPAEWIEEFAEMGAYFSFSPYFLYKRKEERVQAFRKVPSNRILIETDAPAMLGPEVTWADGQREFSTEFQHPVNITKIYERSAEALEMPLYELTERCEENFLSLYHA